MRLLFSFQHFSTELVFAALGVVVAMFWTNNPWLIPFAIAPLILIHRALSVPQLQAEARVDPKTGLFNARHFSAALTEELGRAQRFERPMSLIMADLDLLREINNTYGHLAGDAVLKGIADVFRAELRTTTCRPGSAARSSASCSQRRRRRRRSTSQSGSAARSRTGASTSRRRASRSARPSRSAFRVPEGRAGPERAHPPGRPRRLPREAAGPQPRARSELRAAPRAHRTHRAARRRSGGGGLPAHRVAAPVEPMPEPETRHTRHTTTGPRFLQLSKRLALAVGLVSTLGVTAGTSGSCSAARPTSSACSRSSRSSASARRSRSSSTTAPSPSARSARWPARPCSARGWPWRSP